MTFYPIFYRNLEIQSKYSVVVDYIEINELLRGKESLFGELSTFALLGFLLEM